MSRMSLSVMVVVVLSLALAIAAACTKEVVKEVEVPGETIIVEKEVVKEVEVPGETIIVEKEVVKEVEVPGETIVVEKEVVREVEVEVVVEKEVIKEVVVEKIVEVAAMVEKTYPLPGSVLTIAVVLVGPPLWHTRVAPAPNRFMPAAMGIQERLTRQNARQEYEPILAAGWDLDDNGVTWHLQQGVPWHDPKWGTLNAEDVEYTFVEANRGDTASGHAVYYNTDFENHEVVDRFTLFWPWKTGPNLRWAWLPGGIPIENKDYFDAVGEDFVTQNALGTGPYMLVAHAPDDSVTLEAVKNHWRETAGFETVRYIEVPEALTRISMLKTGAADITDVGIPLLDQVQDEPDLRLVVGALADKTGAVLNFGGNWQVKTNEDGGPNTAYRTALENPWVGDAEISGDLERALKVRQAMSYAIDRELILETILGGHGCTSFVYTIDTCSPRWDPKMGHPYDPEKAKELMTEGGFADGFTFNYWIPGGLGGGTHAEISQAFVPMWEEILGLTAVVDGSLYSARRPQIAGGKEQGNGMKDIWNFAYIGNLTNLVQFLDTIPDHGSGRVLFNEGFDYEEAWDLEDRLKGEFDTEKAWAVVAEFWEINSHIGKLTTAGTLSWVDPLVIGPKIGRFETANHSLSFPELEGIFPD